VGHDAAAGQLAVQIVDQTDGVTAEFRASLPGQHEEVQVLFERFLAGVAARAEDGERLIVLVALAVVQTGQTLRFHLPLARPVEPAEVPAEKLVVRTVEQLQVAGLADGQEAAAAEAEFIVDAEPALEFLRSVGIGQLGPQGVGGASQVIAVVGMRYDLRLLPRHAGETAAVMIGREGQQVAQQAEPLAGARIDGGLGGGVPGELAEPEQLIPVELQQELRYGRRPVGQDLDQRGQPARPGGEMFQQPLPGERRVPGEGRAVGEALEQHGRLHDGIHVEGEQAQQPLKSRLLLLFGELLQAVHDGLDRGARIARQKLKDVVPVDHAQVDLEQQEDVEEDVLGPDHGVIRGPAARRDLVEHGHALEVLIDHGQRQGRQGAQPVQFLVVMGQQPQGGPDGSLRGEAQRLGDAVQVPDGHGVVAVEGVFHRDHELVHVEEHLDETEHVLEAGIEPRVSRIADLEQLQRLA